jgi:hypothetical protein
MARKRARPQSQSENVYDQASRFVIRLGSLPMLLWLLGASEEDIGFVEWLDTRGLPWPGQPDRTCDTVAWLTDRARGDVPWAVVVEVQVEPDAKMFGRLLIYLGTVWMGRRPARGRGDRFNVGAVVVNLTGKGHTGQSMRLGRTRVLTDLSIPEWNFSELDAEELFREVEAGRAPRLALAFLPLMQKGGDQGIIDRWVELARQEPDKEKREALALAEVFAEKAGCGPAWNKALKGWDVMESQVVKRWTAQARAEGEAKGEARGKAEGEAKGKSEGKAEGMAEALVKVLQRRFKAVPDDLRAAVAATQDAKRLTDWIDLAFEARSLRAFRQKAGL